MSISDQKETQESLDDLRARFEDLVDSASDWLWEMDQDLRFTYITDGVRRFNGGIDPSVYYRKTPQEIGAPGGTDPKNWRDHLAGPEARRPFRNFRYTSTEPDGGVHY